jgi:acyl dehydratase
VHSSVYHEAADPEQAGSSGDYNLIHVSPLLAKYLFGLPTAIAHGNLMVAAAARALELHAPDSALSQQWRGAKPFRVIVAFRSIMAISRTFELRAGEGRFLVAGKGKVCVDGKSEEM